MGNAPTAPVYNFPDGEEGLTHPFILKAEDEGLMLALYHLDRRHNNKVQVISFLRLFGIEWYAVNFYGCGFTDIAIMARLCREDIEMLHIKDAHVIEKILVAAYILNSDRNIIAINKSRTLPLQDAQKAKGSIYEFAKAYQAEALKTVRKKHRDLQEQQFISLQQQQLVILYQKPLHPSYMNTNLVHNPLQSQQHHQPLQQLQQSATQLQQSTNHQQNIYNQQAAHHQQQHQQKQSMNNQQQQQQQKQSMNNQQHHINGQQAVQHQTPQSQYHHNHQETYHNPQKSNHGPQIAQPSSVYIEESSSDEEPQQTSWSSSGKQQQSPYQQHQPVIQQSIRLQPHLQQQSPPLVVNQHPVVQPMQQPQQQQPVKKQNYYVSDDSSDDREVTQKTSVLDSSFKAAMAMPQHQYSAPPTMKIQDSDLIKIKKLEGMGFSHEQAKEAYIQCGGDDVAAASWLFQYADDDSY